MKSRQISQPALHPPDAHNSPTLARLKPGLNPGLPNARRGPRTQVSSCRPQQADQPSWGPTRGRPGLTAVRDPRGLSEVPFPRTTKGGGEKGLLCVTESPGTQSVGLLSKRRSRSTGLGFQGWAHGWLPGLRGPRLWRLPWCVVVSRLVVNYCVRPTAGKAVWSGVAGPSPPCTGHSLMPASCSRAASPARGQCCSHRSGTVLCPLKGRAAPGRAAVGVSGLTGAPGQSFGS